MCQSHTTSYVHENHFLLVINNYYDFFHAKFYPVSDTELLYPQVFKIDAINTTRHTTSTPFDHISIETIAVAADCKTAKTEHNGIFFKKSC